MADDWIRHLVRGIMRDVRSGVPFPEALRDAAHSLHPHEYADYEARPSALQGVVVIRHRCECGEDGIGSAAWCEETRGHDHPRWHA